MVTYPLMSMKYHVAMQYIPIKDVANLINHINGTRAINSIVKILKTYKGQG